MFNIPKLKDIIDGIEPCTYKGTKVHFYNDGRYIRITMTLKQNHSRYGEGICLRIDEIATAPSDLILRALELLYRRLMNRIEVEQK